MKTYSILVLVKASDQADADRKVSKKFKDDKTVFPLKARSWERDKKPRSVLKMLLFG